MEEETESKLLRKIKKDPSVPLGLLGLTSIVLYGAYNFKKKKISTSLYLIQLRLAAQGTLLTSITIGLFYSLYKNTNFMTAIGLKSASSSSDSNKNDANE